MEATRTAHRIWLAGVLAVGVSAALVGASWPADVPHASAADSRAQGQSKPDVYPLQDQPVTIARGRTARTVRPLKTERTVDGREALAGRLIVGFHSSVSQADRASAHRAVSQQVGNVVQSLQHLAREADLVDTSSALSLDQVARAYRADPHVRYAEPDYIVRKLDVPNDPLLSQQWGLSDIRVPAAWQVSHSSASVRIAVLDCGIFDGASSLVAPDGQPGHPDIRDKVQLDQNFTTAPDADDYCNHGTHVAGIAAATTNNGIGVAGVGYSASLLNGKVLDDTGAGTASWSAAGITWAADNGARIINMSLGSSGACPITIQDAVDYAWSKGALLVAAAGNGSTNQADSPANCNHVLSVSASDQNDSLTS